MAALPPDGGPLIGGVALPPGRRLRADLPVWATDEPVADSGDLWADLHEQFSASGLWPLVLETLEGTDRPWGNEDGLDPSMSTDPASHDAETVLRAWWDEAMPDEEEDEDEAAEAMMPFGRAFPGLAPASTTLIDDEAPRLTASMLSGRIGLVAVARPADAVAALGWQGPANYYTDMGPLAAVLRSWEDRFGAVVVGIGFDTLTLAVARPPATGDHATLVAAEHFAVAPDNVWQDTGSIADYAAGLTGAGAWRFWWD